MPPMIIAIIAAGLVIMVSLVLGVYFSGKDKEFVKKYSRRITILQLCLQIIAVLLFIRAFVFMRGSF